MELRVVEAGTVGAARSQALWHGIAAAMSEGDAPVLSMCRPASPYVCLGYHGRLDDVDHATCRGRGIPVLRRQIGGGPVWIDSDQVFFQLTMPAGAAPGRIDTLYAHLLAPAVAAFKRLGLDASLRGLNDIAIGDRKISGTGAGRIGDGVTVVGNLLLRFPHERMVSLLALPTASARAECLRLMQRRVTSVEGERLDAPSYGAVVGALVEAYAGQLGLDPVPSPLSSAERAAIAAWETRVVDPAWVAGPALPGRASRHVKICAGVFVLSAATDDVAVEASIVDGRIERVHIEGLGGAGREIAAAVAGHAMAGLTGALAPFGAGGARVRELLETAGRRIS